MDKPAKKGRSPISWWKAHPIRLLLPSGFSAQMIQFVAMITISATMCRRPAYQVAMGAHVRYDLAMKRVSSYEASDRMDFQND
jgi:hypothetical protein